MRPPADIKHPRDGYGRQNFTTYQSERKRAQRHLRHTLDLAELNGISRDVLAAALLDTAAGMMLAKGGPSYALASLESAFHKVVSIGLE